MFFPRVATIWVAKSEFLILFFVQFLLCSYILISVELNIMYLLIFCLVGRYLLFSVFLFS